MAQAQVMEVVTEAPAKTAGFRRFLRAQYIVPLAVILLVGLALLWHHYTIRESTDDAQIDGHIMLTSTRVGGTVLSVNVKDNQYVEAGALLAQIDPKDYEIAVKQAQADLDEALANAAAAKHEVQISSTTTGSRQESAQAKVEGSQAQLVASTNGVESAAARVREAEANYTKASKDVERFKQLVAKDEISARDFDAAVAAEQSAQATLDSARASLVESQQKIKLMQSGITQAQADLNTANTAPQQNELKKAQASSADAKVEQKMAALEQAKLNLGYTEIRAVGGGWVSKRGLEAGQVVQPGQPLLAIVPLDDLWITANFKETQLKKMRPGQEVEILVDTYGGRKYTGHVDSIAPVTGSRFSLLPPENASGNYVKVVQRIPVKIILDKGQNSDHLLRPGMSVEPTVITN